MPDATRHTHDTPHIASPRQQLPRSEARGDGKGDGEGEGGEEGVEEGNASDGEGGGEHEDVGCAREVGLEACRGCRVVLTLLSLLVQKSNTDAATAGGSQRGRGGI